MGVLLPVEDALPEVELLVRDSFRRHFWDSSPLDNTAGYYSATPMQSVANCLQRDMI
jgi:hypothetical protein